MDTTDGSSIVIILDSPNSCYYSGTNVSGKVIITGNHSLDIRGLIITINGKGQVSWQEEKTRSRRNRRNHQQNILGFEVMDRYNVTYSGEEEYFINSINILGETMIPAGEQIYPFSIAVPPNLPSSFSGEYGGIKYTVKALIDRPWKFDQEASIDFHIVTPIDLNNIPSALEPVKMEVIKKLCCFFCNQGSMSMCATLPYKGYAPGQALIFNLEVDNPSSVDIDSIVCVLEMRTVWKTHVPNESQRTTFNELSKLELGNILARGSKTWSESIIVPEKSYPTEEKTNIIKVQHVLEITAEISGCHFNLSAEIPLIIGTIPLRKDGPGVTPIFHSSNLTTIKNQDGNVTVGGESSCLLQPNLLTPFNGSVIHDATNEPSNHQYYTHIPLPSYPASSTFYPLNPAYSPSAPPESTNSKQIQPSSLFGFKIPQIPFL